MEDKISRFDFLKLMFHKLELGEYQLRKKEEITDFDNKKLAKYHQAEINLMIDKVGCIEELIKTYLKLLQKLKGDGK